MYHLTRTLAMIALVVVGVLAAGAFVALAQTAPSSQRSAGGVRSLPAPTPPPLPLGDQSQALGHGRSVNVPDGSTTDSLSILSRIPASERNLPPRLTAYTGHRPTIPKLTDLLKHKTRRTQSASGGSIVLTGTSSTPFLDDQTLSWGATVYWLCQNLKASTNYRYVIFPPDGTAYVLNARDYNGAGYAAQFATDTQGRCLHTVGGAQAPWYGLLALQTPVAGAASVGAAVGPTRAAGSDNPYSGVWTIAVQNMSAAGNPFEAMAFSVVIGTLNFDTYSNAGFSTVARDFPSGSNVYVSASGLNPAHYYAFGFVNTSGNGLPCVFSIPAGSQNNNNGTCFVIGSGGIIPLNGTVSGTWTTPAAGPNSVGTYAVQLYDTTTNDLISTQQISLNPSTVVWSPLVPFNGATNGTNLNDIFATDGIINTSFSGGPVAEQSVTGVQYAVSGVVNGRQYQINVSNGNGVILNAATTDTTPYFGSPQAMATQAPFTAAGTTTGNQRINFPINTAATNLTAFGPTQTPFAPNVFTAQLYDMTTGVVVGSKSFSVVAYAGSFQWTSPAGAYVNVNALNAATAVTATLRNTAGTLYGNWNGDGIKSITIYNDLPAGAVQLARQAGVTTTTDSTGQVWNIGAPVANSITITPAAGGQFLPLGATIPLPISINAAAGQCNSGCTLRTSITPLHGINPSTMDPTMTNRATNGLLVYANGVNGVLAAPTYSWQVGAYSGPQIVQATPRYTQMMYNSGTNQATGGTYTLTLTVKNNGAPSKMHMLELVMPATVNPNTQLPVLTGATINGVNQLANWHVYTQNGVAGNYRDANLPNNAFSLQALNNNATTLLSVGQTGVFTFTVPIMLSSFPMQEIGATANIDDIFGATGGSYAVGPNNTLTNAVAGTTNIDSTELGVYSLDTNLMSMNLSPQVVASLANQSTTLSFINTSTGLDPNPDYISQLIFTIPTTPVPSSVTVTSPSQPGVTWYANAVAGSPGKWHIELCTPDSGVAAGSAPCGAIDSSSLPPGAELDMTINWAVAPAVGQFRIPWTVVGANGNAQASPALVTQQPLLTVANTTAQIAFTYAGGYGGPPAGGPPPGLLPVTAGTQPMVGAWSDFANGNGYVFELTNNGSTPITNVAIAIPSSATGSGQITDAQDWQLIPSSIYTYGAGAAGAQCSANGYTSLVQPIRGSPGTPGLLRLAGCTLAVGQKLDVFFYSLSPYDVGSTFTFPANVGNGAAPAVPTPANMNTTMPGNNTLANTVRIISNARLVLAVPNGGVYGTFYGGAVPTISCPGCTYSTATNLVNLNNITGTVNVNDVMAATVYSDDSNGWSLSVYADVNNLLPGNKAGQLSTWVSPAPRSSTRAGFTIAATASTIVPTNPAAPLALSSYNGAVVHNPLDNLMNYTVQLDPLNVPNGTTTTVTLTYTLIAN